MDAKTLLEELNERPGMPVTFHHGSYAYQTMLSALSLAAAVEGPEEETPRTDARVFTASGGQRVAPLGHTRAIEIELNNALRALKAERASNEIYRNHILSRPNEDQDSQAQEHESQPDKASDQAGIPVAALAAQEGRHD